MKRIISTIFTSIFTVAICCSQDVITKNTNEEIKVIVLEVTPSEINFKNFDNLDDSTYTILKSEVLKVRYENGTEVSFAEEVKGEAVPSAPSTLNADLYNRGQSDASKYYKGYIGAGTGTLIIGLLSPLVGLIPAIACSSTPPKETSLNYPNAELMKQTDYHNGYAQKAKRIKQGKVWSNLGIAFGVNLVAVIIMSSGQ